MFKFNFNQNDDNEEIVERTNGSVGDASKCVEHIIMESKVVRKDSDIDSIEGMKVLKSAEVVRNMAKKPEFLNENSDLVKNVYEGGFKIWECSVDLAQFITKNLSLIENSEKILDLGCGAGLPGLICLNQGKEVHFQDYNQEVIDHITIPNVIMNNNRSVVRFFSGDWSDFTAKQENFKYDLILTSETIYEAKNHAKLLSVFDHLLAENGTVLLAAKIHYFGVGGSLRQFESLLKHKWTFRTVFENNDSVTREIVEIRRNKQQ